MRFLPWAAGGYVRLMKTLGQMPYVRFITRRVNVIKYATSSTQPGQWIAKHPDGLGRQISADCMLSRCNKSDSRAGPRIVRRYRDIVSS
jgi:hypothetical protein